MLRVWLERAVAPDKPCADNAVGTSAGRREAGAATSAALPPAASRAPRQLHANRSLAPHEHWESHDLTASPALAESPAFTENSGIPGFAPLAKKNVCSLSPPTPASQFILTVTIENSHCVLVATDPSHSHQQSSCELLWLWSFREQKPVAPALYALPVSLDSGLHDNRRAHLPFINRG